MQQKTDQEPEFLQGNCSFCSQSVELLSAICRTPFNIFAEDVLVFLQNTSLFLQKISQQFYRKPVSIFFRKRLIIFAEYMRQRIQEWTKQNLWKIAFKKFEGIWSFPIAGKCAPEKLQMRTLRVVPLQQFCKAPLRIFAEYLYLLLQKTISKISIYFVPVNIWGIV